MEVADRVRIWPVPTAPNETEVALAKPPPEIVTAPPPLIGPVLGLTDDTEGHPSAPWSARDRFWSIGGAQATGRVVAGAGGEAPPLVSVKSLFPEVTSEKFELLPLA